MLDELRRHSGMEVSILSLLISSILNQQRFNKIWDRVVKSLWCRTEMMLRCFSEDDVLLLMLMNWWSQIFGGISLEEICSSNLLVLNSLARWKMKSLLNVKQACLHLGSSTRDSKWSWLSARYGFGKRFDSLSGLDFGLVWSEELGMAVWDD